DRRSVLGRLLPDLLDVPEPARPLIQPDQGHGDGYRHRDSWYLLRIHGERRLGRGRNRHREVHGAQHGDGAPGGDARHRGVLGSESKSTDRRLSEEERERTWLRSRNAGKSGRRRRTTAVRRRCRIPPTSPPTTTRRTTTAMRSTAGT